MDPDQDAEPSVVPVLLSGPEEDAVALRKAIKGFGTNETAIIQLLTRRTNEQRQEIAVEYRSFYARDLVSDLKKVTSGGFRDLLVALMSPLSQFYAKELHDAIAGLGTDEDVIIEIMCTVRNQEIQVIKRCYADMYQNSLEEDLRGDTSGHFKKLLVLLCKGNRDENGEVDEESAREDAKKLYEAGEGRLGTNEGVFTSIFSSRSLTQLLAIFDEYKLLTGHEMEYALKEEFSGDIKKTLMTIVKVARNTPLYFADRLHDSMKGFGTRDRQLIRIMVTRCDYDLRDISEAFQDKYNATLQSWIEDDCSGYYKKCLLGLLGL